VDLELQSFVNPTLDAGKWSVSPRPFLPSGRVLGRWVGQRAGL